LFCLVLLFALSNAYNLTLIRGGEIYSPDPRGRMNLLIGGTKVLQFTNMNDIPGVTLDIIDATGMIVTPGLIDVHCHAAGGGGEAGPASRTPEAQLDQVIDGGVTTMVGLLGTDVVTRTELNLLAKLNGLDADGISTFMWCGGYHVPTPTFTGSVDKDLISITKVIGAGEICLSDHRSSFPTIDEITRMVANARVGGMLSGKAGKVYFHVGSADTKIDLLWQILKDTEIPITQMYPTHMTRTKALVQEGIKWIQSGGFVDFTADDTGNNTVSALLLYKSSSVSLDQVSVSSDAYGSKPKFDAGGNLIAYTYVKPVVLLNQVRNLILNYSWSVTEAFKIATSNPGKFLSLNKGEIKVGDDADILILDKTTLQLKYVFARGQLVKTPTWTKQPMIPVCDKSE